MSFLASVGVTNVDLMYVGMPRVPQEGEEIFSQDFRVLLGGGAPGTAVNAAGWAFLTRLATYLGSDLFSRLCPRCSLSRTAFLRTIWRRRARLVFR